MGQRGAGAGVIGDGDGDGAGGQVVSRAGEKGHGLSRVVCQPGWPRPMGSAHGVYPPGSC
jgi:hypothetical protein